MKSILLCRVSSKEQEETGYSLPAQEKLLKEYANKKLLVFEKVFSISESASGKKQRETFLEMIRYVKENNIKIIICEKVDRLTRNLKDAVSINDWINEDSERQVHFIKENFVLSRDSRSNEKFIWNIKVSVAQYYIDNLSEEVRKGQKEKIAQGWLPTKPPLGYKTIGEKGHKIHVVDDTKAPLVKKMFELYSTSNYSIRRLTQIMYEQGLRNINGKRIIKTRIHEYLSDPFYIGKNRWKGQITAGRHEVFITEDLFNTVQSILRSKNTPKYSKHLFLFTGVVKCDECKGSITWEIHKGHIYGHCNHYHACSQKIWSKEDSVEKQIIAIVEKLQIRNVRIIDWVRKALKEHHKEQIEYQTSSVNELNQTATKLQKRLDELYDDKLDGVITHEFYDRKNKKFSDELITIQSKLKKLTDNNSVYYQLGLNYYDLAQKGKLIYNKARLDQKRQLIRIIFKELYLR